MDLERYKMTLDDIPPWTVKVVQEGVPYGFVNKRIEPGYLLANGTALPGLKQSPQVHALFSSTIEKLKQVLPGECQRIMADIHAVYKGRNQQSIRERGKTAQKSSKKEGVLNDEQIYI